MSLARNKKGLELSTLGEIILIVVATGLLLGVFSVASLRAEEKTAENLCRGFNAIRFGTEIEGINVAPRACKTIDKRDMPTKNYKKGDLKEGAESEIRDLMARCWWMWLEGYQQNMFDKGIFDFEEKCFICYAFNLDKNIGTINYDDFAASLIKPYYALDTTDRCAPGGQGGECMQSCDTNSDYFSKEVTSDRCDEGLKCCIAQDARDECKNKGGRCLGEKGNEYTMYYPQWQCRTGACYIKPENLASYLDYIQGTGGVGTGEGKVLFGDNEGFKSQTKYAVTFVSPGKTWNLEAFFFLGTTGVVAVASVVALVSGVGTIPTLAVISSTAGSTYLTTTRGTINDINYIMLSKYDTVKEKCAAQAGVGESD